MQKDADRLARYAAVSLLLPLGILALGVVIAGFLSRSIVRGRFVYPVIFCGRRFMPRTRCAWFNRRC